MSNLFNTVISNGYCIGCGACEIFNDKSYSINLSTSGKYVAHQLRADDENTSIVCPFGEKSNNEDELGADIFERHQKIKHNKYIGYYLNTYAGYVKKNSYRELGSSGGMVTWLAAELYSKGLVDKVIHVRPDESGSGLLYKYEISDSVAEIRKGAKSKYYPINMSEVIDYVKKNEGKYLLIGVPCFIKAIRLLSREHPLINKRIVYTIGLVCGHLKSDIFAKSMAWEMGINSKELSAFDFRVKMNGKSATRYGVEATKKEGTISVKKTAHVKDLFVSNWGHGMFKYTACDYCDDLAAELADITFGDAWLPQYTSDSQGTNIVIVRNPELKEILEVDENLFLEEISVDDIYQSQAGGYRHRIEGLQYRLYLKDQSNTWRPKKRYKASNKINYKRKKLYKLRTDICEESYTAYDRAVEYDDFNILKNHLYPLVLKYNKLIKPSVLNSAVYFAKRTIKKTLKLLKILKD